MCKRAEILLTVSMGPVSAFMLSHFLIALPGLPTPLHLPGGTWEPRVLQLFLAYGGHQLYWYITGGEPFQPRFRVGRKMAGYLAIARLKPFDADVDVETLSGQAVFACLPREHSTAIHSPANPTRTPLSHHSHLPRPLSLFTKYSWSRSGTFH
ncbi:hypothetical protein NA56DRAFT_703001 [Hyaloscypha hepaticicola]|uniref:Uncharacterized protein n=1 Tax=Hyaloscypha hepaticicola TaxID=2082293 RepID=A0A2J6Q6Y2_9HELO|nr:hypothetical protein NA56DRAFT_703001 [Hyaloscypha hepaticicola]